MALVFETAAPVPHSAPQRADVACFIGFVARRAGQPLPAALRAQLQAAGWVQGPYAVGEARLQALDNLPVALDSWHLFDRLFAWDQRPVLAGSAAHCSTWLGAAVRSFFARGGQRAIIVRVGDPWGLLDDDSNRQLQRLSRLRALIPGMPGAGTASPAYTPLDPLTWRGLHHLQGLAQASLVLLPDLADACAPGQAQPDGALPPLPPPEGFVPCTPGEAAPQPDAGLRHLRAPRLDEAGFEAWSQALQAAQTYLAEPRNRRDTLLLASLPLAQLTATQGVNTLALVRQAQPEARSDTDRSFIQLAWPWLKTAASVDLPEGLEPPCGALAGLVAAGALAKGTFHSVAGNFSQARLRDVWGAEPVPAWGLAEDSPARRLARHVCMFAPQPAGWALQSDVTLAALEAWRFGGANRLVHNILRSVRAAGEAVAFAPNGPALWAQLERAVEAVLLGYWHEGAFNGQTASQAFEVRCDRSTMTQADLDAGRLIVRISLWPAASIERITVTLNIGEAAGEPVREAA